jgi:hypothetical protein
MDKELRNLLIGCGASAALIVSLITIGAANTSTSPDRVITCKILTESISTDEWTWTTWDTDRCGVLYAPNSRNIFDGAYARAIRDLDVGHIYRIRVHDVHKLLSDRTHVVEVEGEAR